MSILQAVVLGIIQGLTEFIPVSSSGHLILVPSLLGWPVQDLSFDVALHFGTVLALLTFFYRDWAKMINAGLRDLPVFLKFDGTDKLRRGTRRLLTIITVLAPVAIAGILFEDAVESILRSPLVVASMLILVGILMMIADKFSEKNRTEGTFKDYLVISLSQIAAFIPGTSRSGITIITGLFKGLTREASARISFLLATPIILGAVLVQIPGLLNVGSGLEVGPLVSGVLASYITGLLAIKWLLNFLNKHGLFVFGIYRIAVGVVIILFL